MKSQTDLLKQLEQELLLLQARTYRAHSPGELEGLLETIGAPYDPDKIAVEDRPFLQDLNWARRRTSPAAKLRDNNWEAVRNIDLGLTGVDYALADTGTLILFAGTAKGRWVSLAPRIHVALLPLGRILPSLDEFFPLLDNPDILAASGSAVTFITGASRTADIELKLVMGAHGPKELHVITLLFPTGS
jgi:L-lactate dehydrogenase complex protein LldG